MKKIFAVLLLVGATIALVACSSKPTLYLLNWGEYINEDLVKEFEDTYNVNVILTLADSNEAMEEKIKSGTTAYDVVIPSDYMIEKLYNEGYLQEIDLTQLTNYSEDAFMDGVNVVMSNMFTDNENITSAYQVSIPYFWGVFGIMYNNSTEGLQEYIEANGWNVMFDAQPATFTEDLKVGMYDVSRFAYSLSMIYAYENGYVADANALNTESETYLTLSQSLLSQKSYEEWQTDMLKKDISAGLLDYAFTYVGDFFDTYLILSEEASTAEEARALTSEIGIFVPENTIAFYDGMVIPTNARNVDLALKFIDFFLNPMVAYENSGIVGYTTTLKETYNMIYNATEGDLVRQAMVQDYPYNPMTSDAFSAVPLKSFSTEFTYEIAQMVNRVKTN